MLDHLITGGTIVDGTGSPGYVGDLGIRDGRIVALGPVGSVTEEAVETFDASGLIVTPGFVDPHTHYDAQLHWDPLATPSNVHGVTSMMAGNCGFTLAPLHAEDADYTRRMMAKVEGMALPALENGVDWNWETFAEYLDRLDGKIAVNTGFMVGHCALRRYVMGADATAGEATPEQIAAMVAELRTAIEAGGMGLSTTRSSTHSDGDGVPVASRHASVDELVALSEETGRHPGTSLEAAFTGGLDQFFDDEIELIAKMSGAANRTLNWNVLTVDSTVPKRIPRQLGAAAAAEAAGGRVIALTMPVLVPMNMNFGTFCSFNLMPGWGDILGLPIAERIEQLSDPDVRAGMVERSHSEEAGVFRRLADWDNYVIGDTYSEANAGLSGRRASELAEEWGTDSFSALVRVAINDDLRTILWPGAPDNDPESWRMRTEVWDDPRAMIGGSDAGAHLDRMSGAPYTTRFLGDTLRGRKLIDLERAVQLITDDPARLFGFTERGRLAEGYHADVVVFDPEQIGAGTATLVRDLPGDSPRLTAEAHGMTRVYVNGVVTVIDSEATGATPGKVLRSGLDTAATEVHAPA
ncbi:MAG TPA: amidohydrolase family protein [Acidimicrobiales bacterium]|nr:amidohydrolase family protein [Acidimicrobiales bacterium]